MNKTSRPRKKSSLLKALVWFMTVMFLLASVPPAAVFAAGKDAVRAIAESTAPIPGPNPANVKRVTPNLKVSKHVLKFSQAATDDEIRMERVFTEPLIPMTTKAVAGENPALVKALSAFAAGKDPEKISDLTAFLTKYPKSRWAAALDLNLGLLRYQTGYFTDALKYYQAAWSEAKGEKGAPQIAIADRAFGELAVAEARLGKMPELTKLLAEGGDRPFQGSVAGQLKSARYGLYMMQHEPENAFKCGPYSVGRLLQLVGKPTSAQQALIKNAHSTQKGTSLSQVKALSDQVGLSYQAAKRSPGAAVVVPSIIHFKQGHFAAVVAQRNGKYYLKDQTFDTAGSLALSTPAIEAESDGYFLVPAGPLPAGWRAATQAESDGVWGRGEANAWSFDMTCDFPRLICSISGGSCKTCFGGIAYHGQGMAQASVYEMQANLNIQDQPLSYSPPIGPDISFLANYNQNEGLQPSNFLFTNLTQDWTFNWCAYLTVDASQNVTVHPSGGGVEIYNYSPPPDNFTSPYAPNVYSQAQIVQAGGGAFQRLLPNGAIEVYNLADAAVSPTAYFLTQIIDPQGNIASIGYDSAFRIMTITDAIGQVTHLTYASTVTSNPGYYLIATITDPFTRTCSFGYDTTNTFLLTITDCVGMVSTFTYQNGTFINSMTNPYGTTGFYNYAPVAVVSNGMLITFPDGTCSVVESWLSGNATKTSYIWDREATMLYPSDVGNHDFSHAEYFTWLLQTSLDGIMTPVPGTHKNPLETPVVYTYPNQPQNPIPGAPSDAIGSVNKPSQTSQALDFTVHPTVQNKFYQYNAFGQVTQYIDPVQRQFSFLYAANNVDLLEERQTRSGANDLLGKWEYNNQHLPVLYINGSGQKTQYFYNTYGQLTSIIDANSNTTTINYTGFYVHTIDGPLSGSLDVTTFAFDSVGRIHTVSDSLGYTLTFSYDNMDRLVGTTYPDGTSESTTWYRLDPVAMADRLGRITQDTFDNMDQLVSRVDALGRTTKYSWCVCGSPKTITDGNGNITTWNHDLEGRVVQKVLADLSTVNYSYDAASRLQTFTDALSQTKSYTYNLDDSVSQIGYSVGTTLTRYFSYDPNYLRLSAASYGGSLETLSYAYNPYITDPFAAATTGGGRLLSITNSIISGSAITFGYDALGRLANRSVTGSSNSDSFGYDAISRVTSESSSVLGNFTFGYGANASYGSHELASITYPFGTPTAQTTNFTWYSSTPSPTPFEQLQQITNVAGGSSPPNLSQHSYTYNAAIDITQWVQAVTAGGTTTTNTINLGYDLCDQLLTATGTSPRTYTYDNAGNRTSINNGSTTTTATPNNLNQIISLSGGTTATLTYDLNGNMTSDGTNSYQWDAENQLLQIIYPGSGNNSQFSYDPMGSLVKIVETVSGSITSTKQFVRTSTRILEERNSSGAVTKQFFAWGQSISGANSFCTRDHLGSVRDVTNSSGGLLQYAYDPYGVASSSGAGTPSDFQFAGYYSHSASGLNLTENRAYSATLGRWINRDPIEEEGGINLYAYVLNSPANDLDPMGLAKMGDKILGAARSLKNMGWKPGAKQCNVLVNMALLKAGAISASLGDVAGIYNGLSASPNWYQAYTYTPGTDPSTFNQNYQPQNGDVAFWNNPQVIHVGIATASGFQIYAGSSKGYNEGPMTDFVNDPKYGPPNAVLRYYTPCSPKTQCGKGKTK